MRWELALEEEENEWPRPDAAFVTLLLAVVALASFAVVRCDPRYAIEPETHFARKALSVGTSDMVVAGDSRIYRGIAVERLARRFGARVLNFGFSGETLCGGYLEAVGAVLDPDAATPSILLGVSPLSFRDSTRYRTGHQRALDTIAEEGEVLLQAMADERWRDALAPIEPELVLDRLGLRDRRHDRALADDYVQVFHPDGWVASDRNVEDPEGGWHAKLPGLAVDRPHDSVCFDDLLARLDTWGAEGIRLAVFRVPTSPETARLEEALWPVDWSRLIQTVVRAGGIWIESPEMDLRLYDGSHLDAASAVAFTDHLVAELIQAGW